MNLAVLDKDIGNVQKLWHHNILTPLIWILK